MTRIVQFSSCSLARLIGGLSLVVAIQGAAQAGSATGSPAKSDARPGLAAKAKSGIIFDWCRDFIFYSDLNLENAERSALPPLSPDEPQTASTGAPSDESDFDDATTDKLAHRAATESAIGSDARQAATEGTTSDSADRGLSDDEDSINEIFSEYFKYKFGRFGGCRDSHAGMDYRYSGPSSYYGEDRNVNPDPPQASDSTAHSEDSAKPDDDAAKMDDSPKSSDAANENDDSSNSDDSSGASGGSFNSDDWSKSNDAANTKDESSKADKSPKSDAGSDSTAPGDKKNHTDAPRDDLSNSSTTLEDYYRYRDEPIEGQFGRNPGRASEKEQTQDENEALNQSPSTDDSSAGSEGGDGQPMSDEVSAEETAGNSIHVNATPLADAMLAVLSQAAEEFVASQGLNFSHIFALLPRM